VIFKRIKLSQTRDLFFDEFYSELEDVIQGIQGWEDEPGAPSILAPEARSRWRAHSPNSEDRPDPIISVDGGVQISRFAYGGFVTVARGLAIVHSPGREPQLHKRVKIHIQEVYDDRDRGFIPTYARMIAEYDAAHAAAESLVEEGLRPAILMDGSLYLARFPYAIREYTHHPNLLAELFESITRLRALARDHVLPLIGVAKDSTVFYLHMRLLRDIVARAGLWRLAEVVKDAFSPLDLRMKAESLEAEDKTALEPFLERRPLCDTALMRTSTGGEGYTQPLLLAPSIYYGRSEAPALYERIRRSLPRETASRVVGGLRSFFDTPGVAVTYWRPPGADRPFRVDILANALGHSEPWIRRTDNEFVEPGVDLGALEKVFNHMSHWFCNDVEYNLPLRQADQLARFDRELYRSRYEPFIIRRLERAGIDLTGTRRMQREYEG